MYPSCTQFSKPIDSDETIEIQIVSFDPSTYIINSIFMNFTFKCYRTLHEFRAPTLISTLSSAWSQSQKMNKLSTARESLPEIFAWVCSCEHKILQYWFASMKLHEQSVSGFTPSFQVFGSWVEKRFAHQIQIENVEMYSIELRRQQHCQQVNNK